MITWRTSRFILMSLVLNGVILAFAIWTMINQDAVLAYVRDVIPGGSPAATAMPTPSAEPASGDGQAADVPHYPAVRVMVPARSVFDPAA